MGRVALLLAVLVGATLSSAASAQDAPVCAAGQRAPVHVTGHGYAATLADDLGRDAAAVYESASGVTGAIDCAPITVEFVDGMEDAAELSPPWRLPPWAAGAARPDQRRIVVGVTAEGRRQDRVRTLSHELMHVAVASAAGGAQVPRWFDEGASRLFAGEHGDDDLGLLARARLGDRLPPLQALVEGFPAASEDAALAYAASARAVRLVEEQGGPRAVARVLAAVRGGAPFDDALQDATGRRTWQLSKDVGRSISLLHAWVVVVKDLEFAMALAAVLAVVGGAQARRRMRRRLIDLVDDPARDPPAGVVLSRWSSPVRRTR